MAEILSGSCRRHPRKSSSTRATSDFRGYAQFSDGLATLLLMGAEEGSFVFGPSVEHTLLTGVYRYRVSEYGTLQLASVFGYDNQNPEGELLFHRAGEATEYEMRLDQKTLELHRPGGYGYEFRHMGRGSFPEEAIEDLRIRASSLPSDDPTDPDDDYLDEE